MKPNKSNPLFTRLVQTIRVVVLGVAASSQYASAANQTYQDAHVSNVWDTTTANWDAGVVWTNNNTATFAGTGETVTVSGVTANGITFGSAGYTLTGGTITLGASSTITASTDATVNSAVAGGAVNLTKAGAGTLTLGGAHSYTGSFIHTAGYTVFDTGFSLNNALIAMTGSSGTGSLTIQGTASVTTKYINVGNQSSNSGRIDQTGGTVTLPSGGTGFRLGHWGNGSVPASQYNLTGGTLDATGLSANAGSARFINVGWDGTGTMVVGGGASTATLKAYGVQLDGNGNGGGNDGGNDTLTVSANGAVEVGAGGIGSAGVGDVLILNGGSVKSTATSSWSALINANASTTSVLDANGTTVTLTGGSIDGTGTINLPSATGTVTLNFSGSQTVAASFSGSTPMIKAGSGTTTLSGTSTHNGALSINAGTLLVSGSLGSAITAANTSTLGGEGSVTGSITASTGSSLLVDPATTGALTVGNIDITGQPTVKFSSVPTGSQTPVKLFTYTGTLTSPNGLATDLKGLGGFAGGAVNDTAGVVSFSFTTKNATWAGPGSVWDLKTSANWSGGQQFAWGDAVTFDDTATVPTSITLTGELMPGSIVVNTSTNNFTLTGSTGNFISGTGGLLKSGTSTLTMKGPNTFTGGAVVSQGAIYAQDATGLGAGTVTLCDSNTGTGNASLYLDWTGGTRFSMARPIVISANGTGTATLGSLATTTITGANGFTGGITLNRDVVFDSNANDRTDYNTISGTGNITITGSKRTLFTTTSTFTGNITINPSGAGGNFQIGTATAGATNYIPDSCSVTVNDFAGATQAEFRLSTGSETISGLNGNGTVDTNSISTTLTLGGGNGNGSFTGTIQNGGTNTITLTKAGTGAQVLAGTNTYTGITTVSGGVLQFGKPASLYNGAPASWTAANLTVASGATASFNVGGAGEFSASDIDALRVLSNVASGVTATTGFKSGSIIGLDTTNAGGTFTYGSVIANHVAGTTTDTLGVMKRGTGTLVLSGANTYTGTTFVNAGTLEVSAKGGSGVPYTVAQGATLKLGYNGPDASGGGDAITVNGNGAADAAGVYLQGGKQTVFEKIDFRTAPSTIRSYDTGTAFLKPDLYSNPISTDAAASGSVIDSTVSIRFVNFTYGGLSFTTVPGANTALGDLVVKGKITGNSNGGYPNNTLYKKGSGSLKLTAANDFALNGISTVNIESGSIIAADGNDRLPTTTALTLGTGSTSGKLILGSDSGAVSQTVVSVANSGSGTGNAIVGGNAAASTLVVANTSNAALSVRLGGTDPNENNIALGKSGSSVLTLENTGNSYTGGTFVNGGTLRVNDASGTVASTGAVTVNSGGTLDGYGVLNNDVIVSATGGTVAGGIGIASQLGDKLSVSSLTFNGTGNLSVVPGVTEVEIVNSLTANGDVGSVMVDIGTTPITPGTYTIATHSGAIGGNGISAFAVGINPGGPFTYTLNDSGGVLSLSATTSALFWDGNLSGNWNTSTPNWKNSGGVSTIFAPGSAVIFDDNASNFTVTISSGVAPGSVGFNNSSNDYTLNGGAISGAATISKTGTAVATLANTNTFTGDVTIGQGTLAVETIGDTGVGSGLGAGANVIMNGGRLAYFGSTAASTDRTISVNGNATLELNTADLALTGTVEGSGVLTVEGLGKLVMNPVSNTNTGGVMVSGCALQVDEVAKLGTGVVTLGGGGKLILPDAPALFSMTQSLGLAAGGGIVQVDNPLGATFSATAPCITGTGGLIKTGAGTMTLAQNGNFSGGVTVNVGTLRINAGGWYTNPFGQTNVLTINAGGKVETGGTHSLGVDQNTVHINGGTLQLAAENYISTLQMTGGLLTGGQVRTWGGTMTFNASATGALIDSPTFQLVGAATLNVADGAAADDLTVASGIFGGVALTKSGDGKLVLSGQNIYTGNTVANAGTLELAKDAKLTFALGATSGTTNKLTGSGTVVVNGNFAIDTTAAAALTAGTWVLEDVTGAYGADFKVTDPNGTVWANSGDVWTKVAGSLTWTFDEATGTLILTQSGYDSWASQITNAADRDRGDDPDGDGFTNLQEFLFGTSPVAGNGSLATTEKSGNTLIIRWNQRASGASYALKQSATLNSDWAPSGVTPSTDGALSGDYQPMKAEVTVGAGKLFFRVEGVEN